jgi:2-dehydrotetronate isomerase
MPKFAANLSFLYPDLPFHDRFAAAAGAGFAAVEFAFAYYWPAAETTRAAEAAGVEIVLINLPPGDWAAGERGLAALAGREDEFRTALEQAATYAQAFGCRQLHAMAGAGPGCSEDVFVANLRYAADRLAARGIRLLIEPINNRDVPGYFLTQPEQARAIIERVAHPNLFLQLDLYHCQVMRGDLARQIEKHFSLVRHVQIAGNPGRHEPDVGEINYPYLFALLDRLEYAGWIGCEYHPAGQTTAGLQWMRTLAGRNPGGRIAGA